jgi:hypothetical protein
MDPDVPRYVSPKQAAEDRARLRSRLYWVALCLPLVVAFLAFGYSDQAPAALRSVTVALDRSLGYPILWVIGTLAGR